MKIKILKNYKRHDIVKLLKGNDNVGIELGVAQGTYASRLIESKKFKYLFGIDVYGDHHNTEEYSKALLNCGHFSNYKLYRLTFDQALPLFEDNFFDFVYVDGYAGNGERGGQTIYDWFKKVKVGGIIAGDDYDETQWPLVVEAVNHFCLEGNFELMITDTIEPDIAFCKHPTWAVIKTHDFVGKPLNNLVEKADEYDQKRKEKFERKLAKKNSKSKHKRSR